MFSLLMPTFSLLLRPQLLAATASHYNRTLPYHLQNKSTASVHVLAPVIFGANRLTSELLRTLLRMAASRQTSWLSLHSHLLYHLDMI